MDVRFSFRPYARAFATPLQTAHGVWRRREGFILRALEAEGTVGFGEVAPIPGFGSETVEAAERFLRRLEEAPELAHDPVALSAVPCCAFAISCARPRRRFRPRGYAVAALLPAGCTAVDVAVERAGRGYRSFKWKIGVDNVKEEQAIFTLLAAALPETARFRLDGNEALSAAGLSNWLNFLQPYRARLDYLEQPLAVGREAEMARLAESAALPIALDESLHGPGGWQWLERGAWRGPLVIKPALMGDREAVVERLTPVADQVVLSSVFETACGVDGALTVADALPELQGPVGFDTFHVFDDALSGFEAAPELRAEDRAARSMEDLWAQLPRST